MAFERWVIVSLFAGRVIFRGDFWDGNSVHGMVLFMEALLG